LPAVKCKTARGNISSRGENTRKCVTWKRTKINVYLGDDEEEYWMLMIMMIFHCDFWTGNALMRKLFSFVMGVERRGIVFRDDNNRWDIIKFNESGDNSKGWRWTGN
jgi:hypothetical protein